MNPARRGGNNGGNSKCPQKVAPIIAATNTLSDAAIRKASPGDKPRKLADGGGLYLEVQPSGARYWRLKYRIDGKEKRLSLRLYPAISLAEARRRRDAARTLIADGTDPSANRKTTKECWRRPDCVFQPIVDAVSG